MKYQLSWKLGLWQKEQPDKHPCEESKCNYEYSFYQIVNALSQNETRFRNENLSNMLSTYTNGLIGEVKMRLIDELNESMSLNSVNKVLANMYGLEEIKNRARLVENQVIQKCLAYELHCFSKASFKLFDDLICLRVKLMEVNSVGENNENEERRRNNVDFLYECLIDNAINYKKYQV